MAWALWAPEPPPQAAWGVAIPWDGLARLGMPSAPGAGGLTELGASPDADDQPTAAGHFQPLFDLDFYNRLHLSITVMALGNVVGAQQRQVSVWNAYSYGVTLIDFDVLNGEGIDVFGQAAPPLAFGPLQERTWTVNVSAEGPPVIDTTVVWTFDDGVQLRLAITGNRVTPWTWRPDWTKGILEALEWRTDVIEAEEGDEQRIAMRLTPRQSWEFTASPDGVARQAMESALLGWGARSWALPLWPHGADLVATAAAGASALQLPTFGRDFVAGGLVLLIQDDALNSEVAEVLEVEDDQLVLKRPLAKTWPASTTTVYPAKSARLEGAPQVERFTGYVSDARVRFLVDQANPYAELDDLPEYRGRPVLEDRPDWSQAPSVNPERKLAEVDNAVGVPFIRDRTGVPSIRQVARWAPFGRVECDRVRRLQYLLRGRRSSLWVPSFADDLTVVALAADGATNIDVAWCGYTAYLKGMPGRRDLRIQTDAGVQYVRVTGATDLGNGRERLGLADPLDFILDPADPGGVRISYLTLFRGDSDRLEWAWWSGDHGSDNVHADTPMPMRTFRNDL